MGLQLQMFVPEKDLSGSGSVEMGRYVHKRALVAKFMGLQFGGTQDLSQKSDLKNAAGIYLGKAATPQK